MSAASTLSWRTRRAWSLLELTVMLGLVGVILTMGWLGLRGSRTAAEQQVALADLVRVRQEHLAAAGTAATGPVAPMRWSPGVTPVVVRRTPEHLVAFVKPPRSELVCRVISSGLTVGEGAEPVCGRPAPIGSGDITVRQTPIQTPAGPKVALTLTLAPRVTTFSAPLAGTSSVAPVALPVGALPETAGGTGLVVWTQPGDSAIVLSSADPRLSGAGVVRLVDPAQAEADGELFVIDGSGRVRSDGSTGGGGSGGSGSGGGAPVSPAFVMNPSSSTVEVGASAVFDATVVTVAGSPAAVWQWNFGDGSMSAQARPTKVWTMPGTYTVTLRTATATGVEGPVQTRTVVVPAPAIVASNVAPIARLSASRVWVAPNTSTQLIASASSDPNPGDRIVTYRIESGAGVVQTSGSPTATVSYRNPGTYTARVTVTDLGGLTSTVTLPITVSTLPAPLSLPLSDAVLSAAQTPAGRAVTLTIRARNVNGVALTGATPATTVSAQGNPAGVTFAPASGAISGVAATWSTSVTVTQPGLYGLVPRLNGQDLQPLVLQVSADSATALQLVSAPDTLQHAGSPAPLVVQLTDPFGNVVTQAGRTVTLSSDAWLPSGTGTLSGTLSAVTDALGRATLAPIVTTGAGSVRLRSTVAGFASPLLITRPVRNLAPLAPTVSCGASQPTNATVACVATPGADPEGQATTVAFEVQDGTVSASGLTANVGRSTPGVVTVRARTIDDQGLLSPWSAWTPATLVNRPPAAPVVSCGALTGPTGTAITCSVTTAAVDPDGGTVSYTWSGADRTGSATGTSSTYLRPLPGETSVTVTAADGQGGSTPSLPIALTFDNRAPSQPTLSCSPSSVATGTLTTCVASASADPDGGSVTYVWRALPAGALVTGTQSDTARFTLPTPGSATVFASATDGQISAPGGAQSSTEASASVAFTNRNPAAPIISCSPPSTPTGSVSTCSIATPATDPDGGTVSYTWSATGRTGSATGNSTTYSLNTPSTQTVTATAADGQGGTSVPSNAVELTFTNRAPSAPVITCSPTSTTTGSASTCSIATASTDPDGGTLSYTWSATGRTGAATGTSTTYSLATPGTQTVTATADDGQGGSSAASNSINLTFTNRDPSAAVISCSPTTDLAGVERTCTVVTPSVDPDGGVVTYEWSSRGRTGPAMGLTTTYQYDVPTAENASVAIRDGQGAFFASNIITLTYLNRPPTAPVVTCSPMSLPTGSVVSCSVTTPSVDPDNLGGGNGFGPVVYNWSMLGITGSSGTFSIGGGGTTQIATGPSATYLLTSPGTLPIVVTAVDHHGGSTSSAPVSPVFTNQAPVAGTFACAPASVLSGQAVSCVTSGWSDPDGGTLTYRYRAFDAGWNPVGSTQTTTATTFDFTPLVPGSHVAQVEAQDNQGSAWIGPISATAVSVVNRPPTVPLISCSPATGPTGTALSCSVSTASTDPDGGTITYTWAATGRTGAATGSSTTYTRTTPGTLSASVVAADGQGGETSSGATTLTFTNQSPVFGTVTLSASGSSTLTAEQLAINEAPSWGRIAFFAGQRITVQSGTAVTGVVTASDPDGGTVAWSYVARRADGTDVASSTTGSLTFTPPTPGEWFLIPHITDGQGAPSRALVIPVTVTNRAPTAPTVSCSASTVTTGQTVTCSASGSTDPDGGTVTYNWSPGGRTGSATGPSTTYRLTTPGTVVVTSVATDGQGGNSPDAPIGVTFTNRAPSTPTLVCSPLSPLTNQTVTCTASGSTDPDGGTVSYVWENDGGGTYDIGGQFGTYSGAGNSTFTMTRSVVGGFGFRVRARDGQTSAPNGEGLSAQAFTSVAFQNRPPSAPTVSCSPLSNPTGTAIGCSVGTPAIDPEGGAVSYTWSASGRIGVASGPSTTYRLDQPGTVSVVLTASDPSSATASSSPVSLTFTNRAPSTPSISCSPTSGPTGTAISCSVSGISSDPDGGTITYTWSSTGRVGAATGTSTSYRLDAPGTVSASVSASDGQGGATSSSTVGLTFTNRAPATPALSCSPTTMASGSATTCTATGGSDPDGGSVTYDWNWTGGFTPPTLSGTGNSTAVFTHNAPGSGTVFVRTRDNQTGASNGEQVSSFAQQAITITNRAPSAPSVSCSPSSTATGGSIVCSASGGSDPDGGSISYDWSISGGATISGTGSNTATLSRSTPVAVTVQVRTRDGQTGAPGGEGFSGYTSTSATFTNRGPTLTGSSCTANSLFVGQTTTCQTTWSEPDGGTLEYFQGFWNIAGSTNFVPAAWRSSNQLSFTPTQPGTYGFWASARDNQGFDCSATWNGGSGACWQSYQTITVPNRDPSSPTVSCSPLSSTTGTTVNCTATTSGDPDGHQVELLVQYFNSSWSYMTGATSGFRAGTSSSSYTAPYTPPSPGTYFAVVYVRDSWSASWVGGAQQAFSVTAPAPMIVAPSNPTGGFIACNDEGGGTFSCGSYGWTTPSGSTAEWRWEVYASNWSPMPWGLWSEWGSWNSSFNVSYGAGTYVVQGFIRAVNSAGASSGVMQTYWVNVTGGNQF